MTDENRPDAGEQYPEESAADELAAQKKALASLYRMRDVISGLIALADGGSIGSNQIRIALQQSFKKLFS